MDPFSNIKETDILIRYLAGETNEEENETVQQWLTQSPDNMSYLSKVKRLWEDNVDSTLLDEKFETTNTWGKISGRLGKPARPFYRSRIAALWVTIAASFFVLVYIGHSFLDKEPASLPGSKELKIVSANEVKKITLPDNSMVWLNCNSELTYTEPFTQNRNVHLSGEAYFEVEPNKDAPFEIITSKTKITVLGTKFNVKAYPGNPQTEVFVTTGKVRLWSQNQKNGAGKELILNTGEKGFSLADSALPRKTELKDKNYLSWKTNEFVFDNTNIREIINIVMNTYHVNIVLHAENTQNCNLSGTFTEQSLDQILDMLQVVFKITYEKENDKIVIKSIGCQ